MAADPDHGAPPGGAGNGGDLMERAVDGAIRLGRAWKALSKERRTAVITAGVLWLTLFLPWYQASVVSRSAKTRSAAPVSESLSGWAAFSALEALLLIVSLGIVLLLFLRAEGRLVHAPGSDGWTVTAAGAISVFLVILGLFNAPSPASQGQYVLSTGLEWGIFLALLAAIGLTWAGGRIRRSVADDPFLTGGRRSGTNPGSAFPEPGGQPQTGPEAGPGAAPVPRAEPVTRRVDAPGPPEPHTEATRLGVVEPLTETTNPGAAPSPAPEAEPPAQEAEPPTAETRAASVGPLTAAAAKAPTPVPAHNPPSPDPGSSEPAPPASRSDWRPAERPAWSDPRRPRGWLTARPKDGKPKSEADAPTDDTAAAPEKPEQLTIPLEPDD